MNFYQSAYFGEKIFETDYAAIAAAIIDVYQPRNVVEFGCGPGNLTRELNKLKVNVDAFDGFSKPDFTNLTHINFDKVDLNSEKEITDYLQGKFYDLAICTEVAEHLDPLSSTHLIKYLTACAPVVIFSAAVPEQNGHGHINCRPRDFWHHLFIENNFQLVDSIRKRIRDNKNVAIWYKLNIVDYISKDNPAINLSNTIQNLMASESFSSSLFYKTNNENLKNLAYLSYPLVKQYFAIRNFLKKALKK